MFRHADVYVLCASCGSSQHCILHDLQFVDAGRGCKRRPYGRGILQNRSHDCLIGSLCRFIVLKALLISSANIVHAGGAI